MKNRKINIFALMSVLLFLMILAGPDAFAQGYSAQYSEIACDTLSKSLTPQCKAALPAFRAAIPVVFGEPADHYLECVLIGNLAADPKWKPKFDEGLKFTDAVTWLKLFISAAGDVYYRGKIIDYAFQQVYGRNSTPTEQAYWETQIRAQKASYATIVSEELGKLSLSIPLRTEMVKRAYMVAFGRQPFGIELQYWLPRKEHFPLIIQASRNYLYSPKGSADLAGTVKRALAAKSGKKPSDEEIKTAMARYTLTGKIIYSEM